ncbi:hypothetical protein CHARACLAT_017085 [Characodon lateralis]|uniref:RING-type domain-containing protein n=1 Tax=Characodon lateralis TaxID=208331 RepID=A0ABU7DHW9_9TELE|nr:hypothetical protein [Characodon lateralis]
MKLSKIHTVTKAPITKIGEEKGEVRPHQRVYHTSSDENRPKTAIPEGRITPILEITESFQKGLCFNDKRTMSLSDKDKVCLICHEDMCKSAERIQELQCAHRFHKECMEQWLRKRQTCPMCLVHVSVIKPLYWSSSRTTVP